MTACIFVLPCSKRHAVDACALSGTLTCSPNRPSSDCAGPGLPELGCCRQRAAGRYLCPPASLGVDLPGPRLRCGLLPSVRWCVAGHAVGAGHGVHMKCNCSCNFTDSQRHRQAHLSPQLSVAPHPPCSPAGRFCLWRRKVRNVFGCKKGRAAASRTTALLGTALQCC